MTDRDLHWPAMPLAAWEPTRATLHMWTQIVGKIRLALAPYVNHCWQVPFYVSARGLTTAPMPYDGESVEILFDFLAHELVIEKSDGAVRRLSLAPRSVADFYSEVMATLRSLDIAVKIWTMPVEIPDPIRFEQDRTHASYDRGLRRPVLARARLGGRGAEGVPRQLHRQVQPGAFLLGQLRSRGHPLLRPPRAAISPAPIGSRGKPIPTR